MKPPGTEYFAKTLNESANLVFEEIKCLFGTVPLSELKTAWKRVELHIAQTYAIDDVNTDY